MVFHNCTYGNWKWIMFISEQTWFSLKWDFSLQRDKHSFLSNTALFFLIHVCVFPLDIPISSWTDQHDPQWIHSLKLPCPPAHFFGHGFCSSVDLCWRLYMSGTNTTRVQHFLEREPDPAVLCWGQPRKVAVLLNFHSEVSINIGFMLGML